MRHAQSARRGTILPLLALCLVALFAFVALAIDLGMLAVSRTECQNAADASALAGCRILNNRPGVANSNLAQAVAVAKAEVTGNEHLSVPFQDSQIQKIEAGQYLYNPTSETFGVSAWTDVTASQTATPTSGSWTAVRVSLAVSQPTYFMKVFGVNTMPMGATATAVFRPRDVAFVLDMTGSMAYASTFNYSGKSLNPDNLVPSAGHYVSVQGNLRATANETNGDGEAISRNNFTIATPGGPAIVRDFLYDPANVSNPAAVAHPVTVTGTTVNLRNAFHNIPASNETPGDSTTYQPPTYDFGSYNAFDATRTNGPTPAPGWFGTMTDSGGVNYVGDRYRRGDGSVNKTQTSWATGSTSTRAAFHAADLLGYSSVPSGFASDWSNFRDPVWETHGYDLNIPKYRSQRGSGGPMNPVAYLLSNANDLLNILVPPADRYQGYSMGPGYWGKTFYVWPPDPRFDPAADVTSPNPASPAFDTTGRAMCDWRRRFFLKTTVHIDRRQTTNGSTTTTVSTTTVTNPGPLDPQADSNNRNETNVDGINDILLRGSGSGFPLAGTSGSQTVPRVTTITNTNTGAVTTNNDTVSNQTVENYRVNYPAVLKWLKTGPQTLPPNLRSGRVLYYSSIPDDVTTTGVTGQALLDRVFWKRYIDYVLGVNSYASGNTRLYGNADNWSASPVSVFTGDMTAHKFSWEASAKYPYMRYTDSPFRPRLHFWFGPLSMMDFIANVGSVNWNPGTCHEAQCWQLKVGMNSVLDDVRANHPNDYVGMVMFAGNDYNDLRVPMGQDFVTLKNALFFPRSLLSAMKTGNLTSEIRPYDSNWTSVKGDEIPNGNGSTDPNTGLAYAFNLLSPSSAMPAQYTTYTSTTPPQPIRGRRGAAKTIIFETDGVPNTWRGLSSGTQTMNPTVKGYDTYYPTSGWSSGNKGNGHPSAQSEAIKIVQQIVKPMATTNGNGVDSGLSLPNAPAKVYPVGFGDLFDPVASPGATFRTTAHRFLANVAAAGGTGPAGATTLPDHQTITGSYDQRINRMKDCMQRIFQAGVAVTLIE